MRIAITGASGFVGQNLLATFERINADVVAVARCKLDHKNWRLSPTLDFGSDPAEWARVFVGVDVVVHTAARAHVMRDDSPDPLDTFRSINRDGAVAMAKGAAIAGVQRIVFLSTVKVLGETTSGRGPFRNDDLAAPEDPYAVSKLEAELAIAEVLSASGTELVVLRPPLIYGPGVGGNIAALRRLIRRGLWLPLGCATQNRRSMISIANLSSAILAAATIPGAAGTSLLVSDGDDLSTRDLLCALARADARRPRLLAVPRGLMRILLVGMRRGTLWSRLFGDLRIDLVQTMETLAWHPPSSVAEGMASMAGDLQQIDHAVRKAVLGRSGISALLRRLIDVALVAVSAPLVVPICLALMLAIRRDSAGPALFIQNRVGRDREVFRLVKLRTMGTDTGDAPSHEVSPMSVTRIGRLLRRTKLDELPQLWNILKGEMTFVGPRPCLPSQQQLIDERDKRGLFAIVPGITGPAQVAGIDMSTPVEMAEVEQTYFQRATLIKDAHLVLRTVMGAGGGDAVDRRMSPRAEGRDA